MEGCFEVPIKITTWDFDCVLPIWEHSLGKLTQNDTQLFWSDLLQNIWMSTGKAHGKGTFF